MKKYKVNVDRQKPDSNEILSRRNFDGLMQQYTAAVGSGATVIHKPFWKTGWFIGSPFAAAAAVAITAIVMLNKSNVGPEKQAPAPVVNNRNSPNTRTPG